MKKLLALIVCLSLVAALVGCSRGVTFKKEDWADMEIRVAGYRLFNDDPLNYEYTVGADKFTEEFGTKVLFMVGGGDGADVELIESIVSRDPWEIQYCFGISVFPLAFAQGLYTPISDYIDYANNDMIDEKTVEGAKWMGEYYGVSNLNMQEVLYLAYNETWMKELGIKTPHEYLAEDNWTMDAYKEVAADSWAKGVPSRSAYTRPHVTGMYMTEWDAETGEVKVTYDSPESYDWLGYWGELLTDPRYNIKENGWLTEREVIMHDGVMPNLMKNELETTTEDVIRYIHYPNAWGGLGTYLTDTHFLFPLGTSKKKLPCAFMLSCYMADMKGKMVTELYRENMTEEDFNLFLENRDNAYYIPRIFYEGVFAMSNYFAADMQDGKAVATHIAEQTESLKAKAVEFNEKYVEGFEG